MINILILEPKGFPEKAIKELEKYSNVHLKSFSRTTLKKKIKNYDGIFIRLKHIFNKELLMEAQKLKFIASPTTGLNHIDVEYAKNNNITVLSLKNEKSSIRNVNATAELTWGLLLSLIRRIPMAYNHVRNYSWNRNLFLGTELYGKTLGIIGLGRIGSKLADYGIVFGMRVLATDPFVKAHKKKISLVTKEELLQNSNIISINVPYSDRTINLISNKEIELMKKDSILVNTSRGGIINEDVLLIALKTNRIAGVTLDVLQDETKLDKDWTKMNKLIKYSKKNKNLLITPHIGGFTHESLHKTETIITSKVIKYLRNKL